MLPKKIILSGGGTAGSVMPLVALTADLRQIDPKIDFLFIGGKKGIERKIAKECDLPFVSIFSGKWRKYFDLKNFFDPLLVIIGFFESLIKIFKFKPQIILSAGSYVAVPVVLAGWFLRIPTIVHQQDLEVGLANKIMALFAKKVTVTFKKSIGDFHFKKTTYTGNPFRKNMVCLARREGLKFFKFRDDLPVILVLGGGTGALTLNQKICAMISDLNHSFNVIHLTGRGKKICGSNGRYQVFEFLNQELKQAYAIADIVISRAGVSTLTELAVNNKAVIVVPLPETHQEKNARFLAHKEAAIVISQNDFNFENLRIALKKYLLNPDFKKRTVNNFSKLFSKEANENYLKLINDLTYGRRKK